MRPNNLPRCVLFGPYEADFHTQILRKHGMKLKLSGQPLQILEMLLERPGELVTREELQKLLWSNDVYVDSNHGLNAAVNKLRDALGDSAEEPKYIETLPRRGYRFIGTIQPELPQLIRPAVIPDAAEKRSAPDSDFAQPIAAVPPVAAGRRSRVVRWALFASAAMLLVGVLMAVFLSRNQEMAENVLRLVRKDVAENLAAAAKNSQAQPDAHPWVRAEPSDGKGELRGGTAVPRIRTVSEQTSASPMLRTVVADDSGAAAPQFSPDGKRIAYMSTRTGPWQIWVREMNGANPRQISFTESAGTPRWSPDGRSIAFDAPYDGSTRIFVIKVDGTEQAQPIVKGLVPSFSRDGKWIYFASDQTGDWQVWKVPNSGGSEVQAAVQVTRN